MRTIIEDKRGEGNSAIWRRILYWFLFGLIALILFKAFGAVTGLAK